MQGSVLLATAYLPPIEYIIQCLRFQKVLIERFETYPKQTYRNRCMIATANGLLHLSIPVKKPNGNHTITGDVEIDFSSRWNQVHWRAITSAYTQSPYFIHYCDALEPVFKDPPALLTEFNTELLKIVFRFLKTDLDLSSTTGYSASPLMITDLRQVIHPKQMASYPGKPLAFAEYTQTFCNKYSFIPNLSIIDLIFNEGPGALDYLLSNPLLQNDVFIHN
jgi:hypothetical protein